MGRGGRGNGKTSAQSRRSGVGAAARRVSVSFTRPSLAPNVLLGPTHERLAAAMSDERGRLIAETRRIPSAAVDASRARRGVELRVHAVAETCMRDPDIARHFT